MSRHKNIKVLFFAPHADDIEMGAPFMCLEALKLGNNVTEVLMTDIPLFPSVTRQIYPVSH